MPTKSFRVDPRRARPRTPNVNGGERPVSVVVGTDGQLAVALDESAASATDVAAALSEELGSLMGGDVDVFQLRTLPMARGDMAVIALKERRGSSVGISVGTGRGPDRSAALTSAVRDALGDGDVLAAGVARLESEGAVAEVAVLRDEAESGPAELRELTAVLNGSGRLAVTTPDNAYRAARLGGSGVAVRARRTDASRVDAWLDAVWERRYDAQRLGGAR